MNLNVKRVSAEEARRIRAAALARGETMREFVLAAGRLRADLDAAVEAMLAVGANLPLCPVQFLQVADRIPKDSWQAHALVCPICSGSEVQVRVGKSAAPGWADLARRVGWTADLQTRVAALPHRQREALAWTYGLETGRRRTMAEAGREMGVTREAVHELVGKALAALRAVSRRTS